MPQIRCPNCGTTVNLENRRELDYKLILRALQSNSKTFTELLHITHLPRKTLSLRLKDLIKSERIVKNGGYFLNGSLQSDEWDGRMKRFMSLERKHIVLLLLVLSIGMPIATHVYATYTRPPPSPPPPEPLITEVFTADIVIHDATDLYLWQVAVTFDPDVLVVLSVTPGDFMEVESTFPLWTDNSYLGKGVLLACASLTGGISGIDGSGTLATIEFGVIGEGSRELSLVHTHNGESALLLFDSTGSKIPNAKVTIET